MASGAGNLVEDILDLAPGWVRKEGSGLTLLVITACPHCFPPRPSHRRPLSSYRVGLRSMGNQREDVGDELAEDVRVDLHSCLSDGQGGNSIPLLPRQQDRPSTAYFPVAGACRPSSACLYHLFDNPR